MSFAAIAFPAHAVEQPPNILLIVADDMGYSDPGCYGGEIATPNLDSLAREGLRFTQFYNTARCWPSRAAILTGYYAQEVRRDTVPGVKSGASGTRPRWARLLPEMLRPLGYRCYHSGKWHLDGQPLDNGFDHSYSLNDHDRYFAPHDHTEDDKPLAPVDPASGYYATTAIADHAIKSLREHAEMYRSQPFFEYLAFTSPHFPLQAPPEDIARYKDGDRYMQGWDVLREERWKRMRELGIGGSALSAVEREVGPPYAFPEAIKKLGPNEVNLPLPWSDLTRSQQEFQAAKMAIHAAMVDRMDREIGRVLEQIDAMGARDNTMVLFLSDNGASAEMMVRGDGHNPDAVCGTGATFLSLGPGWSTMANAPFRRHKTWVHEGGISTPLIVRWPQGIGARGDLRRTPGHVIDLVPTVLAAAGAKQPENWEAEAAPPPPGKNLLPFFAKDGTVKHELIWWLHEGNRALRKGDWKIVAAGANSPWELYYLKTDRSESKNLAGRYPIKVRGLAAEWESLTAAHATIARMDMPVTHGGVSAAVDQNTAGEIQPIPRADNNSQRAHQQLLAKAKQGRIDVYFLGDSITRRWGATDPQYRPLLENWTTNFFGWNAANFGWGADKVENILWRLENGELDGVNPRIIVLLAGINNVGQVPGSHEKPALIAEGIKAILRLCRQKAPEATVILTAIFPRNDNMAVIPVINEVNRQIARFSDGKTVRMIDINSQIADANGRFFDGMVNSDKLHPTLKTYQVWADVLKPIFAEILGPRAAIDLAPMPTGDPSAELIK